MALRWRRPIDWRLRSHLAALLVVTMTLTFALVVGAMLALHLPRLEREDWQAQQFEVDEMQVRMETVMQARRSRLVLMEARIDEAVPELANDLLDAAVGDGGLLRLICRLSPQGRVIAAGLPPALRGQREDLLGSDLSANPLFLAVAQQGGTAWRGRYVSILNGEAAVGVAVRDSDGHVLLAEVPLGYLVNAVQVAAGARSSSIWVVDRSGEIVADSRQGRDVGKLNIRNWPLMQALLQGRPPAGTVQHQGETFHVTVSHSPALDWFFIGRLPTGMANAQVREMVWTVLAALAGCLGIGLLVAPVWVNRLARPLGQIIEHAARTGTSPQEDQAWPRGPVVEFNRLSSDLEMLTGELRGREQKLQAIFHASPVPMAVADAGDDNRLLDVNEAWCGTFGYARQDVLMRTTADIDLWVDPRMRIALRPTADQGAELGEAWLRRRDGSTLLVQLHARVAQLPSARLMIWAAVDVGHMRRIEQDLRELNQQLEDRVRLRSEALAAANAELSTSAAKLRTAQAELVRTEKMAALGNLVAGVAHELNTPLGNGVMAVSAIVEANAAFREAVQRGVRRSDLARLVETLEQGADIAQRNLRRAAELVKSFKQVALDQTSSQRRSFELAEVVHEIVVSLRPSVSRTAYRIEADVPATGLLLDSYPGPLGQVVANLLQNAVLHGFDGRDHGTVRITAERAADARIVLRVADDGKGIPPELIERVFDPFMTTKMGRGGSGLGLHVSYNAVTNLLGGTLRVHSVPGEGACFEVWLPAVAPQRAEADADDALIEPGGH
jgi:PAS domain S-box-containing protein